MVSAAPHLLSLFEPAVSSLAVALRKRSLRLASAESCTGGLIAAACTAFEGASDWYERGFVVYSYASKEQLLGVSAELLAAHGAVSEVVAEALARGALLHSQADLAVAVTGIAGPGGAVPGKPVGTVWMAIARRGRAECATYLLQLGGDRASVREQTVVRALAALLAVAEQA